MVDADAGLVARLPRSAVLKKILDSVKDLVKETNWDCNEEGMSMQALDTGRIVLVEVMLREAAFESYACEVPMTLGIDMEPFGKVLRCAGGDEKVTIKASRNDQDHIELVFENEEKERMSAFELKLMDIDGEHMAVPDAEWGAEISMPSSEFKKIVMDLAEIGSDLTIAVSKLGVTFTAQGNNCKGSMVLQPSTAVDKKSEQVAISFTEPLEMTFAAPYMKMITKAAALSSTVTLSLDEACPICVRYEMEDNAGHIKYYLAPKEDESGNRNETDEMEDEEEEAEVRPAKKAKAEPKDDRNAKSDAGKSSKSDAAEMSDDDDEEVKPGKKETRKEPKKEAVSLDGDDDAEDSD
ncbi:Proliferating cell nuclear antigen [Porphyridium purpureum]|uniref:DNA sliding clamp PCNA n=1 Tax=Porphyridium purpureum TaxID=35688 RepID=A0A5J4Z9U8_PORPP|nr:Proliferating cell nuclear antigen [Porphyridium purpureum]|eukprot:POR4940..scf295_1